MDRAAYVLRRLLLAVPTFFGITLVCFSLTRFLPGGPVEMRLMQMRGMAAAGAGASGAGAAARAGAVSEDYRRELSRQFGFDKPLWRQYADWMFRDAMGLRLHSYDRPDKSAWRLIKSRIPVSLWFGAVSFVLTYLVCIPLGIAKAVRHGRAFDAVSSLVVFTGYAIPTFALAMGAKFLLCGTVDGFPDIFPLGGISSDFDVEPSFREFLLDRAWHMALPVACYVAGSFAMLTLLMKNSLLDQISADYVRTAIAKGASRRRAVWGHALRNALVPVATGFGSLVTALFAGSIVIETVFDIPGMGRLGWDALVGRDYAVFLALLSLTAAFQLAGNLASDVLYLLIDPRIDFRG